MFTAENCLKRMYEAVYLMLDPGASEIIYPRSLLSQCPVVTLTDEARTLEQPLKLGLIHTVVLDTDGGDLTLTVTGGYNAAGDTSITFGDAGDYVTFISIRVGTSFYWRVLQSEGVNITRAEGSLNLLDNEYVDYGTGNDHREAWNGTYLQAGPVSSFWAGCPSPNDPDPTRYFEIFDHFTTLDLAATGKWTLLSTNGTAVLGDAEDANTPGLGGFLYMDSSSSADNDYATVKATTGNTGAAFMIVENSGKKLWYETRVVFHGSAATENMYCIGLLDSAADDILTDNTGAEAVTDGFYFRVLAATPTKIDTAVNQSGTETEVKNEAATLVQGTAITLGMYFDGVTTLTFYIDRVALADTVTIGDAGNIPNDVGLTPVFGLKDGAVGTANTRLYADYIKVVQLR